MRLTLTRQALDWFEAHNVSFHNRFGIRLQPGDEIAFRKRLAVEPYVGFHAGRHLFQMGYMSYSNSELPLDIEVGRYCSIAAGVTCIDYDHPYRCLSTSVFSHDAGTDLVLRAVRDFLPPGSRPRFVPNPQKPPVRLGHDVWIGQNAALRAGISIGTGSIVAANAVVTRDVPPYSIVGGNPARLIRPRFEPALAAALAATQWWKYNWTDFHDLDIADPGAFVEQFGKRKRKLRVFRPRKVRLADVPA